MFLIERIVGVGIYMSVLLFVCLLLTNSNISCKTTLKIYLAALCVMAFFYKPYVTADLYRTYESIDYFATIDFHTFWNDHVLTTSTPVAKLLYWCVGKTGVNALLPTFSAFLSYSCIFYIINRTKEIYSISNKNTAYVIFFIMTTSIYISVIGGIRMMIALSMIAYSFFRGTVEKKIRLTDVLFYILSLFIHAMSLVCVGMCVLVMLLDSDKSFVKKIGYVLIGLGAVIFAATFFNGVLDAFYEKFFVYVFGDRHSDPWEYIMGAFIVATLILLFAEYRRVRRETSCLRVKDCNTVTILCVAVALCFFFEFSIFYRFGGQLAVLFSIPSMMLTLEKTEGRTSVVSKHFNFRSVLILMSLVIAAISCTRGSLCSLKFFEL